MGMKTILKLKFATLDDGKWVMSGYLISVAEVIRHPSGLWGGDYFILYGGSNVCNFVFHHSPIHASFCKPFALGECNQNLQSNRSFKIYRINMTKKQTVSFTAWYRSSSSVLNLRAAIQI